MRIEAESKGSFLDTVESACGYEESSVQSNRDGADRSTRSKKPICAPSPALARLHALHYSRCLSLAILTVVRQCNLILRRVSLSL